MTIKTTPSTFQNSLEGQYHPHWEPQIHVKTIWKVKSTFQTHSMINLQKLQWIFSRCCISTLYKRRLLNYKRWVFSFSIKPVSISGNMASESIHLLKTTKNSGLEQFLKRVSEWAEQLRIRSLGTEWRGAQWHRGSAPLQGICWTWRIWTLVFTASWVLGRRS